MIWQVSYNNDYAGVDDHVDDHDYDDDIKILNNYDHHDNDDDHVIT